MEHELLVVFGTTCNKSMKILIDSGANGNFVSSDFVRDNKLKTIQYQTLVHVTLTDGKIKTTTLCKTELDLTVGDYNKKVNAQVLDLSYNLILGKPWLTQNNPEIDWKNNKVTFSFEDRKHT